MSYVFTRQVFYITQGDTLPNLDYIPMDGYGEPVAVQAGDTVVFNMRKQGGGPPVVDRSPAVVVAGSPAYFRYAWQPGDTDEAGEFVGEFEWDNAGRPETFPNHDDAELWVRIRDDIG